MVLQFTPYPYIPPVNQNAERNKNFSDNLQTALQAWSAARQQNVATESLRQQRAIELAKAADEGGQEFLDRYKTFGGQLPGQTPANSTTGFWDHLIHGNPSPTAANPAPPTLTSSSLAPDQAIPRTSTSAPTFTPTEKEDTMMMSLPSEHPSPFTPPPAPVTQSYNSAPPTFPLPNLPQSPSTAMPPAYASAAPAVAPIAPVSPLAPAMAGGPGGPNGPLPRPQVATDITPEHLAAIKASKGSKGLKEYIDQHKFMMEQGKDANAIDQNSPTTYAGAQAVLSPYGEQGQQVFDRLKSAYPEGKIPKSEMTNALTALSGSAKSDFYGSSTDFKEANLRQSAMNDARTVLNPMFQSGPGKDQVDRLNSIGRAAQLGNQVLSQPGGPDSRQMQEFATSVASVLSGGGASAQRQIEELMPHTAMGKIANWQEWLTNNPQGTDQQAFVRRYMDTLTREKGVIQGQIQSQAEANAPTLRVLKTRYPQDYQALMDSVTKNPMYSSSPTPVNQSPSAMPPTPGPSGTAAPQIGEIRRGYRYNGGPAGSQSSWAKVS